MGAEAQSGPPIWFIVTAVAMFVGTIVLLVVWAKRRAGGGDQACSGCGRVILAAWPSCKFCGAEVTLAARQVPVQRAASPTVKRTETPELHFISGPMQGKIVRLEIEVTTIGSAQGNTIVISDNGISKRHVGIKKAAGAFELADLGSTNGVYVNGQKVARRPLAAGDVIRVGVTEIVFRG